MTNQEYTRYTHSSYMTRFTDRTAALRFAMNEYNLGKTKIIMLENGVYGIFQNSLANKFIKAGYYEEVFYGFADMAAMVI